MSRESKIIAVSEFDTQKTISHYESFGWELLSINGNQITVSRETQNPVYSELVKHQSLYEELLTEMRALSIPVMPAKPAAFSFSTWFKTLICFVVPCFVYTTYKIVQYIIYKNNLKQYQGQLSGYNRKVKNLTSQMDSIALESRAIFFSKQS